MDMANEEQRRYWDEVRGQEWVDHAERFESLIAPFGAEMLRAAAMRPGERVLDVGCGSGASSLAAALASGTAGAVVGVDLSGPMLGLARRRAEEAGASNVQFVQADAQEADLVGLGDGVFDAVISRFGVMFFDDPVAAFGNIARATRSGGRLTFCCWQPMAANPWMAEPVAALRTVLDPPWPSLTEPGPFSLGDAVRTTRLLTEAGWVVDELADVRREASFGTPAEAASRFLHGDWALRVLADATEGERVEVAHLVEIAMAAHRDADGVVRTQGAAWVVRGHR